MSLATLSIDLVAKMASFEADMGKAARASEAASARIKGALGGVGIALAGLVTVAGTAQLFQLFNSLIQGAGRFQDIAEKVGDTAQNIASLAVAAATAGIDINEVGSASVKLTKNLTGIDDESKAAGAALTALGINIDSFKKLAAADQFETIAKALDGFAEGSGKTAVAVALLGKSGAELLPFFKELAQQGARQVILTEEQIRLADDYADAQAKSKAQIELVAQGLATRLLPAMTEFKTLLTDILKDESNQAVAIATLKVAFEGFNAVFRTVAVFANALGGAFDVLGTSIGAALAQASRFVQFDFAGAAQIGRDSSNDIDAIFAKREKFAQNLFSGDAAPKFADPRRLGDVESVAIQARALKPELPFSGAKKPLKDAKDTAAQEAKAQLAFDLEQLKKAGEASLNVIANNQRLAEALHAAGLTEERAFFAEKLKFLNQNTAAQEATLQKELERLQVEKLSGKEKIDNDRKILDVQAKLASIREDAATSVKVLAIQETAALKVIAQQYRDAEDAANEFLITLRRSQGVVLSGAGIGNQARERNSGRAQIEDKFSEERRSLDKSRRDAELSGSFGPDAQIKFDQELERIKRFQAIALDEYETFATKRIEQERNWANGANEALANYLTETQDVAKQTESLFTNAFKGAEDALVDFVKTGKLDFSSLADSIISDLIRIQVRQQITGPLAQSLGSGNFLESLASFFGFGAKANGGPVTGSVPYLVGERGPELFVPNANGKIIPNGGFGRGGGQNITVIQNYTVGDVASMGMVRQAVAGSEQRIAGALARSRQYGGALS